MKYDSVKDKIAWYIGIFPFLRKILYIILDFQLLRQWYVKAKIKKYFPTQKKIKYYDAGSGMCQYSYHILKKYEKSEVFAVDIKDDYISSFHYFASKLGFKNFHYQCADLQEFVPQKKYDLITAIDILEHIEDDKQVLTNFKKALNPGGKLIISAPSNFDESAKFIEEHFRPGYSKEDIISKLSSAGFKIISFQYMYGFFGHIYWNLVMKFPLSQINKNKLFMLVLPIYYLFVYPIAFVMMGLDYISHVKKGTGVLVVAES